MANRKSRHQTKHQGGKFSKGRNDNRRQKEVEVDVDADRVNKEELKGSNDYTWYARNEALLKDSASIPFSYATGQQIQWSRATSQDPREIGPSYQSAPGFMILKYFPTFGSISDANASPLNVDMNALYTYVRHQNSGSRNYQAPDIGLYIIAMDSCYSLYIKMVRLYGLLNRYQFFNRYMPQAIVQAMGFDYDSFVSNMANFRARINNYAYKLGQLCIPSDLYIIARHTWMESGIYLDGQTSKAQMYIWNSLGYYQYHDIPQPDSYGAGGYCTYQPGPWDNSSTTELCSIDALFNYAEALITPIIGSEAMQVMSGDILKAFGRDRVYTISTIPEQYVIEPIYNPEVQSQIENAFFIGDSAYTGMYTAPAPNMAIIQNVNNLVKGPYLTQNLNFTPHETGHLLQFYSKPKILNLHMENPSPADVMVATRLMPVITINQVAGKPSEVIISACGTEIGVSATMYAFNYTQTGVASLISAGFQTYQYMPDHVLDHDASAGDLPPYLRSMFNLLSMYSCFDWAPMLYPSLIEGIESGTVVTTTNVSWFWPLCDLDNFTFLDDQSLTQMHTTAVMSQLMIPEMNFNS